MIQTLQTTSSFFYIDNLAFNISRGKKCKPVFTQIGQQVIKLRAEDLRLPARAWKVKLIGEGADDAGGVFDDTITEMCQVWLKHWTIMLLYSM